MDYYVLGWLLLLLALLFWGPAQVALMIAMLNVAHLVIGYAVLYRNFAHIGAPGTRMAGVLNPVQAL